jgi:predicted GH43/DUF377 family glycosyl hydrolase
MTHLRAISSIRNLSQYGIGVFEIDNLKLSTADDPIKHWRKFNASIVMHDGRRLFATRRFNPNHKRCDAMLCEMDESYNVLRFHDLKFPHPRRTEHYEDPRIGIVNGKLYLWVSMIHNYRQKPWVSEMVLFELGYDSGYQIVRQVPLRMFGNGTGQQKNWQFFSVRGTAYCSYWVKPNIVFEIDMQTGEMGRKWQSDPLHWPFGTMSGGTPPIAFDGGFLAFFHGFQDHAGIQRRYNMTPYIFDKKPPFTIRAIGRSPFLYAANDNPLGGEPGMGGWTPRVVFPGGMIDNGDSVDLALGVNDTYNAVLRIPHQMIRDTLIPPSDVGNGFQCFVSMNAHAVRGADGSSKQWRIVYNGGRGTRSVIRTADPFMIDACLSDSHTIEIPESEYESYTQGRSESTASQSKHPRPPRTVQEALAYAHLGVWHVPGRSTRA